MRKTHIGKIPVISITDTERDFIEEIRQSFVQLDKLDASAFGNEEQAAEEPFSEADDTEMPSVERTLESLQSELLNIHYNINYLFQLTNSDHPDIKKNLDEALAQAFSKLNKTFAALGALHNEIESEVESSKRLPCPYCGYSY